MRFITKPDLTAELTFDLCVSSMKNTELQTKINTYRDEIIEAERTYDNSASLNKLHLTDKGMISKVAKASDLINIYVQQMVPKGKPGRAYYDELISSSDFGICPLCNHRVVTTLDHYLGKATYPMLSVVPINLVPACKDCNFIKLALSAQCSEEETLHPYYDNIENDIWLKSEVISGTNTSLKFFVEGPVNWSRILQYRVKYHFEVFDLSKLYASNAAVELNNIRHGLASIYRDGGAKRVKEYLENGAISREKANLNSWQTAMYYALSSDENFCNGGFGK